MKFWDSSAMVPLLLEEPRSGLLRAIAAGDGSLAIWWASPVECCSAVGRLRREGVMTVGEEDEVRRVLDAPPGAGPRSSRRRTCGGSPRGCC